MSTNVRKVYQTRARIMTSRAEAPAPEEQGENVVQGTPTRANTPEFVTPRRLYSDVAASRATSPIASAIESDAESPVPAAWNNVVNTNKNNKSVDHGERAHPSSELSEAPNSEDKFPGQWTTVQYRRSAKKAAAK
jgi:hypothetical protein